MRGKWWGGIHPRRDMENMPDSLRNMVAKLQQPKLNEYTVEK
jgi:hypothetical protein